ncbi:MAG TPA: M48 family metallopeptidase [Rhizomicrobium sp.]|nr:M48 family metallopeptidase [Rhizomicrobium sp.]
MRIGLNAIFAIVLSLFWSFAAQAQAVPDRAPTATIDVHTLPAIGTVNFDVEKATNAYLAQVTGEARSKSDAYFEGGYLLLFLDALYALLISALLLWLRISFEMRRYAESITRSRFWQAPIYVAMYVVITTVATFPLTLYESFFREHAYGLSNQNFLQWLGDFGIGFAVNFIETTIALTILYAVVRASRRTWWLWSTLVAVIFLALSFIVSPVLIDPLFNHYYSLKEGPVKNQILSLARANGIPATNVYEFDASRQSKRISANVSGFMGTTRISLNDNLMNRSTPREIQAVLGHEMGHYVLDHSVILLTWLGLMYFLGFVFVNWGFGLLANLFGGIWNVRSIDDPAGLPAVIALVTIFMLLSTPVFNTIIRTTEAQADIFGLNAARQPDAFATVTLKLSEYRKLDPSPLEEFVFYDHPSGRTRIFTAMRWKAEHIHDPDIQLEPVSPQ